MLSTAVESRDPVSGQPGRPVDQARIVARTLSAAAKPVSRPTLRCSGVQGPDEALNALARMINNEIAGTAPPHAPSWLTRPAASMTMVTSAATIDGTCHSGSRRPEALCDHEGVPRGTASRWRTRYAVRLTVPRRGGWRAWGTVRENFEHALTDPVDPAIASAEIASELRRGADYVRVTVVLTVHAADVADALTIAWDAFRSAAHDDLTGWEVAAAVAEVQPAAPLTRVGTSYVTV